jgi:hypothetical protein
MSINTILSNTPILDALVDLIDAKSGNVATVSGTAPIVVSPTAGNCVVSLPIAGTFVAGSNDVVKGSSASALVWGSDGDSLTFSAPLLDTAGVVSLPIAGTFVAGSNDVVKGSSASALVWGSDASGTVYTGTAPVNVSGSVISLPIAGTFVAGSNDVVKGSSASALVWGPDSAGTVYTGTAPITVTGSVIALTDGAYLLATGGALTLDITGAVGVAGQLLSQSTTAGALAWVAPPFTPANAFILGPAANIPLGLTSVTVLSVSLAVVSGGVYLINASCCSTSPVGCNVTSSLLDSAGFLGITPTYTSTFGVNTTGASTMSYLSTATGSGTATLQYKFLADTTDPSINANQATISIVRVA